LRSKWAADLALAGSDEGACCTIFMPAGREPNSGRMKMVRDACRHRQSGSDRPAKAGPTDPAVAGPKACYFNDRTPG